MDEIEVDRRRSVDMTGTVVRCLEVEEEDLNEDVGRCSSLLSTFLMLL